MRAVVARVSRAAVRVDGATVGEIDAGLLVLLGVHRDDPAREHTLGIVAVMARKLHELRILAGDRSCAETGTPLLVVSQFTLYGDARKGRRPTWAAAAPGEISEPLYDALCAELEDLGTRVERGVFGAQMATVCPGPRPRPASHALIRRTRRPSSA